MFKKWFSELTSEEEMTETNAIQRMAHALGLNPRQLRKRLGRRKMSAKPIKPAPHFRAELQERKLQARLKEQARQGYAPKE